jgi:isoquinoline 1-oxidoreductase beta subunit
MAHVTVGKDGHLRVARVVVAIDCGLNINPDTIVAQIQSDVIFGLSAVLYGEINFKNGRVLESNFDSFRVLRVHDTPQIDVHLMQNNENPGGIGEAGASGVLGAIANAAFAATKIPVRRMPLKPELRSPARPRLKIWA